MAAKHGVDFIQMQPMGDFEAIYAGDGVSSDELRIEFGEDFSGTVLTEFKLPSISIDILVCLFLTHVENIESAKQDVVVNGILTQLKHILKMLDGDSHTEKDKKTRVSLKASVEHLLRGLLQLAGKDFHPDSSPEAIAQAFSFAFTQALLAVNHCLHREDKLLAASVAIAAVLIDESCPIAVKVSHCGEILTAICTDDAFSKLYRGLFQHPKIQGNLENLMRLVWYMKMPGLDTVEKFPDIQGKSPLLEFHGPKAKSSRLQFESDFLTSSKTLREVSGPISTHKLRVIAAAIETNKSLKEIHFESNGAGFTGSSGSSSKDKGEGEVEVEVGGIFYIADALKHSDIVELYIRMNSIGDAGCEAIANGMKENKSIVTLDLWRCNIGPDGGRAIAEMLMQNRCLEKLNLRDNNICDEGIYPIADVLISQNRIMRNIYLDRNNLTAEGKKAMERKFQSFPPSEVSPMDLYSFPDSQGDTADDRADAKHEHEEYDLLMTQTQDTHATATTAVTTTDIPKNSDTNTPKKRARKQQRQQIPHELTVMVPTTVGNNVFLAQSQETNLDLTGDAGAIGCMSVENERVILDLKGEKYSGCIVPSGTFWILNVGGAGSEAKIEAECQDYVQLHHKASIYDKDGGSTLTGAKGEGDSVAGDDTEVKDKEKELELKTMDGMAAGLGRRQVKGKKRAKTRK